MFCRSLLRNERCNGVTMTAFSEKNPTGSAFYETFFWPWPPQAETVFHEFQVGEATVTFIAETTGRIRFKMVSRATGEVVYDTLSCILEMPERIRLKMAFGWGDGGVTLKLNGIWIIASKGEHAIPDTATITGLAPPIVRDFTKENLEAVANRSEKLQNHKPRSGRIKRDDAAAKEALRAAIMQLKDATKHVNNGELHYIEEIASKLRKLIATGDPLPLLQLHAAPQNSSLIVYDAMEPPIEIVTETAEPQIQVVDEALKQLIEEELDEEQEHGHSISGACWLEPNELNNSLVDLDVWLSSEWGKIGEESFSHRKAITKLGDTIGAHFDLDKHPVEDVLRSANSDFGGVRQDYLVRYLMQVADVTIGLANKLLDGR